MKIIPNGPKIITDRHKGVQGLNRQEDPNFFLEFVTPRHLDCSGCCGVGCRTCLWKLYLKRNYGYIDGSGCKGVALSSTLKGSNEEVVYNEFCNFLIEQKRKNENY